MAKTTQELLEWLPASVQYDEFVLWLNVHKYLDGWQVGYTHDDGLYEAKLCYTDPDLRKAVIALCMLISRYM